MPQPRESVVAPQAVTFELDSLELVGDTRVEVTGRWYGARGRRFVRPTLRLLGATEQSRALADLDDKPWAAEDGEDWRAAFDVAPLTEKVKELELAVAPDIAVMLSPPGRFPRRAPTRRPRGPQARQAEFKALAEASTEGRQRAERERDAAMRERDGALRERDSARDARDQAQREREDLASALHETTQAHDRLLQEREALRRRRDAVAHQRDEALARLQETLRERDQAILDRNAAVAERERLLHERDEAMRERDRLVHERDAAMHERDRMARQRDAALYERDAALQEREAAVSERPAARQRDAPGTLQRLLALAIILTAAAVVLVIIQSA